MPKEEESSGGDEPEESFKEGSLSCGWLRVGGCSECDGTNTSKAGDLVAVDDCIVIFTNDIIAFIYHI